MRQFNKFRGTKGFIVLWERMLRFRYMITEQAKQRCRILAFWERHGNTATKEAFKVSPSHSFPVAESVKKRNRQIESLNAGSRCPRNKEGESSPTTLRIS